MKKENLIKDENYIDIQGWMVTKLKLSGNELIIFAIIYGFSQIEGHKFTGSLGYLAEWINSSKQTCINNLKSLQEKKYIIKKEKEINGLKFCEYAVNLNTIQKFLIPIQKSLINNIDNNIDILDNNKLLSNSRELEEDIQLKENIKCIIDYLNESINSKYKYDSKETIKLIKARFKEGYVLDNFYDVIDKKVKEWFNTEMQQYLRPSTLFGNKFEQYLNQPEPKFKGKIKSSYSSNPTFDNTANRDVPKGISEMTKQELQNFKDTQLAKDTDGNYYKF